MKHLKNVRYAIATVTAVAALGFSAQVQAQTENVEADVTIQNTLTIVEIDPVNFGTLVAIRAAAQTAAIPLATTGVLGAATTTGAPAYIALVDATAVSAAEITVEDGAPGATINVNIPSASIIAPTFGGNSFALSLWRVRWNGAAEGALTPDTPVPVVFDAAFNAGVNQLFIGATLSTTVGAVAYADGLYNGSFDVTFSY